MTGRRCPIAKYPSKVLMQFSLSQKPYLQKILAIQWVAMVPVLSMCRLTWKEWKLLVTTITSVCQQPNLASQYSLLMATAVKKAALGKGMWMRTSSSFRLMNSTFRISTDLRPLVHLKSTTKRPFLSSVITSLQVPEMLVNEKCALAMKQGPPTQSLAAVRSSVLMYSISSKISGSKGSWFMAQMSTPPSLSNAQGFSSTSTTIISSSITCMLVTCWAVEQYGPLTNGLEAVQTVVQRQTSLLFLQAEREKSQTQWCSIEMQFSPSSTEGSETNCSMDPLCLILMMDWNCWMNPPSNENAQSSISCTPSSSRSSLTWLTTFILLLHSSQLRRVQLRTEPLSQVESSKTVSWVKLLLQSNWLVRKSVWLRRVSLTQMSSGQLAILTLDLERQLNLACGSLVQVRLKEQSLKESSNTRIGVSYWRNIIRIDPQQTVTQSPKLPVASMRISSYFMLRWKTSQSEETAGRRVRQTMMMVLVSLGSLGSMAWMQTRLPLSEKSRSNLSGITQPKVGKTLFIGASPKVQISSRSCSQILLGGLTRISSPRAIAIFHLQKPGSWVAGDLISASLMGPVLVISRMTTRSMHCTNSTPGWKSEVQTSMGEKQLTPILVMVIESILQSSLHSLSWWSQHSTISKKAISLTYRSTTTRYCPTNSMDWIFPSYPAGKVMGFAPSSALRSTSQMKTSLGSASQRMAARWMYCPLQQWNLLAVRLAILKLM